MNPETFRSAPPPSGKRGADDFPPLVLDGRWNAVPFFEAVLKANRLALSEGFTLAQVSGLAGLADLLSAAQAAPNILSVDDTSEGSSSIQGAPSRKTVKSIFISMAHKPLDMESRSECLIIIHELFRQIMTILVRQHVHLSLKGIQLDDRIALHEIDRFVFPGFACVWFELAMDLPMDLRFRPDEWISPSSNP